MAAATFGAPNRGAQRNCLIIMPNEFPLRMTIGQKAHVQSLAASAGAKHRCEPEVRAFPDEVDGLRFKVVWQILNNDGS